jgi:hypothetical protein
VKRSDLEPLIIAEWLKRPAGKRTGMDVLDFYGQLASSGSYLLSFRAKGDKYQHLKSILVRHIEHN